jgi:hypothetical protein
MYTRTSSRGTTRDTTSARWFGGTSNAGYSGNGTSPAAFAAARQFLRCSDCGAVAPHLTWIPSTYLSRGRYVCDACGAHLGTARLLRLAGCAALIAAPVLLLLLLMGMAAVASLAAAH